MGDTVVVISLSFMAVQTEHSRKNLARSHSCQKLPMHQSNIQTKQRFSHSWPTILVDVHWPLAIHLILRASYQQRWQQPAVEPGPATTSLGRHAEVPGLSEKWPGNKKLRMFFWWRESVLWKVFEDGFSWLMAVGQENGEVLLLVSIWSIWKKHVESIQNDNTKNSTHLEPLCHPFWGSNPAKHNLFQSKQDITWISGPPFFFLV